MDVYTRFRNQIVETPLIAEGTQSIVYDIGDGCVVKLPRGVREPEVELGWLEKQLEFGRELFDGGVSVPAPLDFYMVWIENPNNHSDVNNGFQNGLVLEKIDGIPLNELSPETKERALELRLEELRKCIDLGFIPKDVTDSNSLYVPEINKVYLLDFADWIRG